MESQKVELIPVIEISTYHEDLELPEEGPFWMFPNDWENYRRESNLLTGFSKDLKSYKPGFSFYEFDAVSDQDLVKLIKLKMEDLNEEEQTDLRDWLLPFSGGLVLKINDEDILFPQCCSDLSGFNDWKDLLDPDCNSYFYCGHPFPNVKKNKHEITFDFVNIQIQEPFSPPVTHAEISVDADTLKQAIENAELKFKKFAERLKKINSDYALNIANIEHVFVFGDD